MEENKYFVTPGLHQEIQRFSTLVKNLLESGGARPKPIIILGPSGAGKSTFVDVFTNIAKKEGRFKKKVTSINCAELDGELVRSELFGHEKAAFTGAEKLKEGHLKEADGGILVLEEIGELSKDVQAKLLIALDKGEYFKLGGTKKETINSLAIVATTNQEQDSFRQDFWFRCLPFYINPICKRRQDILYYLNQKHPKALRQLDQTELLHVLSYNWPGNLREINNIALFINTNRDLNDNDTKGVLPELNQNLGPWLMFQVCEKLIGRFPESTYSQIKKYFLKYNLSLEHVGKRKLINRIPKSGSHPGLCSGLKVLDVNPVLEKIYLGFKYWCEMFSVHYESKEDCLYKINNRHELDYFFVNRAKKEQFQFAELKEVVTECLPELLSKNQDAQENYYKKIPKLLETISGRLEHVYADQLQSEEARIKNALTASGGNVTKAASLANMSTSTFRRSAISYGLIPERKQKKNPPKTHKKIQQRS
jgi:transcriptional regulator with AAA-type ATPase domain